MMICRWANLMPVLLGMILMDMGWVQAGTIPIFTAGVNASGNPLTNGAADPHWTVTLNTTGTPNSPPGQAQAITTGYPIGNWYDPSAHGLNARWITPSPFSTNWTDGEIDYSQTFSMAGLSPSRPISPSSWLSTTMYWMC